MRLETFPLILGVLIGLIGIGLILDAWAPDNIIVPTERRLRPRRERDRWGEALVGLGIVAMALAFIGRDTWRYTTVTVIAGAVLLLWGTKRNGGYLRGVFAKSDVPKVAVPKVAVPKVAVPKVSVPEVAVPKVAEGSRRIR